MSLIDDAVSATAGRYGRGCGVKSAVEALKPKERAELKELLSMPVSSASHAAISSALHRRGVGISADTIGRHRRGTCSCELA